MKINGVTLYNSFDRICHMMRNNTDTILTAKAMMVLHKRTKNKTAKQTIAFVNRMQGETITEKLQSANAIMDAADQFGREIDALLGEDDPMVCNNCGDSVPDGKGYDIQNDDKTFVLCGGCYYSMLKLSVKQMKEQNKTYE